MSRLSAQICLTVLALAGTLFAATCPPAYARWARPCCQQTSEQYHREYGYPAAFTIAFVLQPASTADLGGWEGASAARRRLNARRFEHWVWPARGLGAMFDGGWQSRAELFDPRQRPKLYPGTTLHPDQFSAGLTRAQIEKQFGHPVVVHEREAGKHIIQALEYKDRTGALTMFRFVDGRLVGVSAGFARLPDNTGVPPAFPPETPAAPADLKLLLGTWDNGSAGYAELRPHPTRPGYLCGYLQDKSDRFVIEKGSFDRRSRLLRLSYNWAERGKHADGVYQLSPDGTMLDGYVDWSDDWGGWWPNLLTRTSRPARGKP